MEKLDFPCFNLSEKLVLSQLLYSWYFSRSVISVAMVVLFLFLVAQNRVSAFWFEGKELAFAFGATLAFSSLVRFLICKFLATGFCSLPLFTNTIILMNSYVTLDK